MLQNSLSSTTTLVIDNLKPSLASKNEAIYQAAKESINSLVKYVGTYFLNILWDSNILGLTVLESP